MDRKTKIIEEIMSHLSHMQGMGLKKRMDDGLAKKKPGETIPELPDDEDGKVSGFKKEYSPEKDLSHHIDEVGDKNAGDEVGVDRKVNEAINDIGKKPGSAQEDSEEMSDEELEEMLRRMKL